MVLILITLTIVALYAINRLCEYSCWKRSWLREYPEIRFETFRSFYQIAPDTWELDDDCVVKIIKEKFESNMYRYWEIRDKYSFSFKDTLKYRHWKKAELMAKKKRRVDKLYTEQMSRLVEETKKDIAKYKEASEEEAINKLKEIWGQ